MTYMFLILMIIQIPRLVSHINYYHYLRAVQRGLVGIIVNCGRSTCFNYNYFVLWFSEQFLRYSCLDVYPVYSG